MSNSSPSNLHSRCGLQNPSTQSIPYASLNTTSSMHAEPGKYWLIDIKGQESWPGVECDRAMVTKYFHNRLKQAKFYPMLFLGTTKFDWVARNCLRELDVELLLKERNGTADQILRSAYEDIFTGRSLDYWKNDVSARLLEDPNENEDKRTPKDASKSKRKAKALTDDKKMYGNWNEDDSEMDLIEPLIKRSKLKPEKDIGLNSLSGRDLNALYRDSDSDSKGRPSSTPVSSTLAVSPESVKSAEIINPDMAYIYVGNPYKVFPVKLSSLQQSALLLGSLKSQGNEHYIMNPMLSETDAQQFAYIAEYLNHSEYKPKLVERGTIDERLENVSSRKMRSDVIIQCGYLYNLAGKIQLPSMQDLCFGKLKAIKNPPIPELLAVVRQLFSNGHSADELVHDYVVSYISDNFYEIWEAESDVFLSLLKECRGVARAIYERLGRVPKVKGEETKNKRKDETEEKPSLKQET